MKELNEKELLVVEGGFVKVGANTVVNGYSNDVSANAMTLVKGKLAAYSGTKIFAVNKGRIQFATAISYGLAIN